MTDKMFVNNEGMEENPQQQYFFQEYWRLPRATRTLSNLSKVSRKKEEENKSDYPTPPMTELYTWSKSFEWDKRIQDSLYNKDYMAWRIDDNLHEYEDLKKLFAMTVIQARGMKKHIDWKHTHKLSHKEVELLQKTQKVYNDTLDLLFALNNDLTEVMANVGLIQDLKKKNEDSLPFEELLTPYEE